MARIEFEYHPTLYDYRGFMLRRLWEFWPTRLYYILLIVIVLVMEAIHRVYDLGRYGDLVNTAAGWWVLAALIPFVLFVLAAGVFFKRDQRFAGATLVLDEKGYTVKASDREACYKWEGFGEIKEAKRYICLRLKGGGRCIIFERVLPDETLRSVREVIAGAPVPKKELMP